MGYYTRYTLSIEPSPDTPDRIAAMLAMRKHCREAGIADPPEVEAFFASHANAFAAEVAEAPGIDNVPLSDVVYALGRDLSGGGETKWYDHENDMKFLSAKYPSLLFTLHGEGEESADIWKKYFLGGKCQVAKAEVKIEAFDPNKLK